VRLLVTFYRWKLNSEGVRHLIDDNRQLFLVNFYL
jgi:hypothetical protein